MNALRRPGTAAVRHRRAANAAAVDSVLYIGLFVVLNAAWGATSAWFIDHINASARAEPTAVVLGLGVFPILSTVLLVCTLTTGRR